MIRRLIAVFGITLTVAGCSQTLAESPPTQRKSSTMSTSWYHHGTRTANGERFNPDGMTAAHKTLPFGTKLHLTYKGKSVIVRINDRGPFIRGRDLDLARGAARYLGCTGVCVIEYKIIS